MQTPPLDPPVSDSAPSDSILTAYDEQHLVTYLRLLDAEAAGADWREVAGIVLHIDPVREPIPVAPAAFGSMIRPWPVCITDLSSSRLRQRPTA